MGSACSRRAAAGGSSFPVPVEVHGAGLASPAGYSAGEAGPTGPELHASPRLHSAYSYRLSGGGGPASAAEAPRTPPPLVVETGPPAPSSPSPTFGEPARRLTSVSSANTEARPTAVRPFLLLNNSGPGPGALPTTMPSASRRRASLPTYMSGHPSGYLATSEFAIHSSSNFEVPPAAPERTSAGAGSRAPLLAALQQRSNLNNSAPGCCDYRPGLAAAEKACGGSTSGPRHVSGPGLAPQQRSPGATMQPDPGDHTGFAVHRTASMPVGAASYSSMRLNLRAAVPGVSITSKAALATDLVRALSHARRGSQDGDQNRLAGSRGGPANVMVIS